MRVTDLRPEVLAFAFAMETTLRKHDTKKGTEGWKNAPPMFLADYTVREAKELYFEIKGTDTPRRVRVLEEAADTGNLAMMVADVCGALPLAEASGEIRRLMMGDDMESREAEAATFDDDIVDELMRGCQGTDPD